MGGEEFDLRGRLLGGEEFTDDAEGLAGVQSHGIVRADFEGGSAGGVFVVRKREGEASVLLLLMLLLLRHCEAGGGRGWGRESHNHKKAESLSGQKFGALKSLGL